MRIFRDSLIWVGNPHPSQYVQGYFRGFLLVSGAMQIDGFPDLIANRMHRGQAGHGFLKHH